MMRRMLLASMFLFASLSFAYGGDTTTFEADVVGPAAPIVSIEVPDYVFLPKAVARGAETNRTRIDINNTGNVAVKVTPQLVSGADPIFNYLYFERIQAGPYLQIGSFSYDMDAPGSSGVREGLFYAKLDLENYTGNLDPGNNRRRANVRFIAVAQ
ncbi:hypothetical protein KW787_02860 [Candidatus Pacearchaeota archaeon]|nr:hypothetical protein [Candidatus Pacearchaeota archaeon]